MASPYQMLQPSIAMVS